MTDIDTMTIKDARDAVERGKEIEKMLGGSLVASTATREEFTQPQIAILDRGFVFVGNVAIEGDWLLITDAQNVRRWGTSRGLGELAAKGPLKDTVLDPAGAVRVPVRAWDGLIKCEAASWKK